MSHDLTTSSHGTGPMDEPTHAGRFAGLTRYAWPLAVTGAVLLLLSGFFAWSYDPDFMGDLSINFYPGPVQILAMLLAAVALFFLFVVRGPLRRIAPLLNSRNALVGLGAAATTYLVITVGAIAVKAGGLINVDPGGWVALVGAVLLLAGAWLLPRIEGHHIALVRGPSWVEILIFVALLAAVLFGAAYLLNQSEGVVFFLGLVFAGGITAAALRSGLAEWLGAAGERHRRVLTLGAFVVAFLFPFTQNGSNANMSIAAQVLIFATTALGLNIVVGLAGLLDLGYIAFLGAGAYVGATMSRSVFATIAWKPPFLVVVLIGALVAATLGLIIGSPTLRVSGDYLAIVTLAFGEIFRLTMFNLDGTNGPNLTNGPNGIPAIPDLKILGFDFAERHTVLGIALGRFANYYFLLLVLAAFVITVFARLNDSRIGRGWIAIREDERAAEAMGVNVFGLKVFAFAGGAFLAGMAGTVKSHLDVSVTPDQYIFLESAFLLAAVVLGGMGTVAGVLVGATILKLMPEKLRFISEYRLMIFGLLLVLMMRFRPEGLIANKRRILEFHEDDEHLAEVIDEEHVDATKGARA